jgi:hypothetical protein
MKRILHNAFIISALIALISCGSGEDSIFEVNLFPVKSGKEFQYIDKEGKIVINPQFKNATIFRNGLALVETSGDESKFGFISEDGKFAINAQYKEATVFSEGIAWVVIENSAPTAIDKTGEIIFTLQEAEEARVFKNGLAAFSVINEEGEEKWGFVNKEGRVVINPQFSSVSNFSDGKCSVRNSEGKWGFIDKDGKIIIGYQFDEAGAFKDGKCIVTSAKKKGIIDKNGKYIINPQFTDMQIDGDMFLINQDGKWGWCDKDGKFIINPQFGLAFPFNDNEIASVQLGKSFGYIDKEGKILINPQFDGALPFNGKLALVVSGQKVGFINNEGKYVINPQFDAVSNDFITHLILGSSEYSSVSTDYFNVGAITSILNFESPEGLNFNSTFEDIMKKYELKENNFRKNSREHELVSKKKISNDASYSFYAIGNLFDTYVDNSGWYSKTEYVFNPKNNPIGYAYSFSLSGKGYGKSESVISSIEAKLIGYKKDENRSYDGNYVYTNGKNEISIKDEGYRIIIVLNNDISDEDDYEPEDATVEVAEEYDAYD